MKIRSLVAAVTPAAIAAGLITAPITQQATPAFAATKPAVGTIFVADINKGIFSFAPGASGNVAPLTHISGASTNLNEPTTVAPDEDGSIWVGGLNGGVLKFAPGATGNVAPVQDIEGDNTTLGEPTGIEVARDGSIWVADQHAEALLHFGAHADGDVTPLQSIAGPNTGIDIPRAVALTPDGKHLWAIDVDSLREFGVSADGDVAPQRVITGDHTGLASTEGGVYVAGDNSIWAAEFPNLAHFPAGAKGNVAPTLVNSSGGGIKPFGIRPDAKGNLWMARLNKGSVVELPPTASGHTAYLNTIAGAATGIKKPWGAAVYGFRPSAVRKLNAHHTHHKVTLKWHKPSKTGGAIGLYLGQRKTKHHKWHIVFGTKSTTHTDRTVKRHTHYKYRVIAINGYGWGATQVVATSTG